jgi:hypothetical protein
MLRVDGRDKRGDDVGEALGETKSVPCDPLPTTRQTILPDSPKSQRMSYEYARADE